MLRATLCALLVVTATPLRAQEQKQPQVPGPVQSEVALALVLAVDASGSVNDVQSQSRRSGSRLPMGTRRISGQPMACSAITRSPFARSCHPPRRRPAQRSTQEPASVMIPA